MTRSGKLLSASFVVLAALLASPASHAGVDVSFGMYAPMGDDGNLFFSISSRYFDREPQVVQDWGHQFPNPDDLAVFLHVCSHTQLPPPIVYSYRRQGLSWYEVGVRAGLPVSVWYVPVVVDPGPPYGKAYGHWKKHRRNPSYNVRLTDRQARDLVAMRMAHEYYGVTPEVAMNWRRQGSSVQDIMTREYHTRHRAFRYQDDDGDDHYRGNKHGNHHGNKHHDDHRDGRHGHHGNKHDR
jgi:hypothetical protein